MSASPSADVPPSPAASPYAALEEWLAARRHFTLAAVAALAIALRVACFVELATSPCYWVHEWTESDMNTFHRWALKIAEGDAWSRSVGPPIHQWHHEAAVGFARAFPQRWAEIQARTGTDDPAAAVRLLWNQWCGGGRTYQGPLYPYLIAFLYYLLGPAVGWVFAVQTLLGVGSVLLVYLLTRRYFGDLAAVIAAVLALGYGPLLFFEFVLLRASLIVFFGLLLVFLLDRAHERRTALSWLPVGVILGLALALKAHFALMILAVLALLLAWPWRQWDRLGRCAATLCAGLLISFSPVIVRNVVAGAPPLALASNAAPTFLIANSVDAGYVNWGMRHVGPLLGQTDNAFWPTVVATLKTHPSVFSYLRLIGQKAFSTWFWYEEPNNVNFYYGQLHSRVLASLPVSFGLFAPLALVGLVLALPRFRRRAPLYFLVLTNLTVLYVFFVFARFRLPLAAALLPFAGFGGQQLIRFVLTRRWRSAGALVIALAAVGLLTAGPSLESVPRVRNADVEVGHIVYYDVRVGAALARGDFNAAAAVIAESLAHQPPEVRALGPTRPTRTPQEAELGAFYAAVHEQHARVLREAGRLAEARRQSRRATDLRRATAGMLPANTAP
jgi:hypothetical protein